MPVDKSFGAMSKREIAIISHESADKTCSRGLIAAGSN